MNPADTSEPFEVDRYAESEAKIPQDVLREIPAEDKRGFWAQLASNLRVKFSVKSTRDKIEGVSASVSSHAKF